MRAKMEVRNVTPGTASESLRMVAVCGKAPFGAEGESEDNTFARWTPGGELTLQINNPNLLGKFQVGQKFYLDFTEAAE